jgi:hypothetical protein
VADTQPTPQQQAAAAATVAALVGAQGKAYDKIENSLAASVKKLMDRMFNRWYYQKDVAAFVNDVIPLVRQAQESIAAVTEQYMVEVNKAMGVVVKPSSRNFHVTLPDRLRQVDPKTEWNRPARAARVARLLGADEFLANERAQERAQQMARMDALLAQTEAEKQMWGVSDDIVGYRRIIHPELGNQGPVCGLCVAAASRTYAKIKKRSLHGGCRCTVLPITKDGTGVITDPGFDLNREDLDRIYKEAGGTGAAELRSIDITTIEHGELGPILVNAKYRNRVTAKPKDESPKLDPQKLFDIQKRIVDDFDRKVREGTTPQFDIEYHRRQLKRLAKELGIALESAA